MSKITKEEVQARLLEAIKNVELKEGWMDRLKARALSMGKSKENKALSRAMTILKGFEKQAIDSLMDLQQLTGDDAQTQKLIKSVEESMTEVIARIEDASKVIKDEMVGNKWLDKGPSKKDLEALKDEEPEAEAKPRPRSGKRLGSRGASKEMGTADTVAAPGEAKPRTGKRVDPAVAPTDVVAKPRPRSGNRVGTATRKDVPTKIGRGKMEPVPPKAEKPAPRKRRDSLAKRKLRRAKAGQRHRGVAAVAEKQTKKN